MRLSQNERSKLNLLAFAIVGAVLGFSPQILESGLVAIGLAILVVNAFVFGFLADCIQRNNNIANADETIADVKKAVKPFFDGFHKVLEGADAKVNENEIQHLYSNMQDEFKKFVYWHHEQPSRYAKKTHLGIGYWYFAIFGLGLIITGIGIIRISS